MTGDPIISVTMATISNKADPDLVLELFPARLNDFDHLLRREVQYVSLFEVYPHWILIICILSFTTDTYELSICCKTSNWLIQSCIPIYFLQSSKPNKILSLTLEMDVKI